MSGQSQSQKRKRSYYMKAAKGKRSKYQHTLEPGLRGFLITCNNREKEAVREAYNILNEYAEEVSETDPPSTNTDASSGDENSDSDEDIGASLQKELSSLKAETHERKRFQVTDTGANNCIFIKTTLPRPDLLAHKMFSELHETKTSKSRFIMRLLPVIGTCRATDDAIDKLVSDLLPQYFGTGEVKSYCVLSKVRNNSSYGKQQSMPILRRQIQELNPLHHFDPDNPDYIISMDIMKSVCCVSVLRDFVKFRKYNMQEVVKPETEKKSNKEVTEEAAQESRVTADQARKGDIDTSTSDTVNNRDGDGVGNDQVLHPETVEKENCDSISEKLQSKDDESKVPVINSTVDTDQENLVKCEEKS